MQAAPPSRLRDLTALWDRLAELHSKPSFRQTFTLELHTLSRFQSNHPGYPVDGLLSVLEGKVRAAIIRTFPADKIRTAA